MASTQYPRAQNKRYESRPIQGHHLSVLHCNKAELDRGAGAANPGCLFLADPLRSRRDKNEAFRTNVPSVRVGPLLEEYLAKHRPVLVKNDDPGTLFINHHGKPMSISQVENMVKKLTAQYAGVAVTPHIYRDIVAFEWLRNHPEDYLTVSKLLWHRNINTTIRTYGHRFDESTGVARMDDWRTSRSKMAS